MITWQQFMREMRAALVVSTQSPDLRLIVQGLRSTDPTFVADALLLWQRRAWRYHFNPSLSVASFQECRARRWSDCGSAAAICGAAARLVAPTVPLRVCYETAHGQPGYAHAKLIVGSGHVVDVWADQAIDVRRCNLTGWL